MIGLFAALWIAWRWDILLMDVSYRTPETLLLSGIMLVLVLEGCLPPELIEVPYAQVAFAAAIPSVLYYFGLYVQVDLLAGKGRFERLTEQIPTVDEVLRDGWHFLIPFAVLLFTMFFWERSPEISAISSSLAMFVVGMVAALPRTPADAWRPDRLAVVDRPQHHRPVPDAGGRRLRHRRAQRNRPELCAHANPGEARWKPT